MLKDTSASCHEEPGVKQLNLMTRFTNYYHPRGLRVNKNYALLVMRHPTAIGDVALKLVLQVRHKAGVCHPNATL